MDESPFGRLPAELRNRIYEYVLGEADTYFIMTHFNQQGVAKLRAFVEGHPLALARTCRTTSGEFVPLFYSSRTFMIKSRVGDSVYSSFQGFASTIGQKNAAALRNITLREREQPMDSFETVCSTHNDINLLLGRVATLKRDEYPFCQFRVQVDLVHCSPVLAKATFLLDLDFDSLESSWDLNTENLRLQQRSFHLNGDSKPIKFILENCREHLSNFMDPYGRGA